MKVLLVVHGYPPELIGGTEKSVQATARGLIRLGHEVIVVAGSLQWEGGFRTSETLEADPESGKQIRVLRIHRADLYFDHWQKSLSVSVGRAFRDVLQREEPDVVHVHHWIRLTRDLVAIAAEARIPAVVTLHDLWISCLLAFRLRPGTQEFCDVAAGPDPCVQCAARVPPRADWLSSAEEQTEFDARHTDLRRELALARTVLCLSRSHGERLARYVGLEEVAQPLVLGHDYPAARAPTIPPPAELGRLVLGTWGSLTPVKGVDLIFDAIERSAATGGMPIELHVAGQVADPAYAERIRTRARALDVWLHGAFEEGGLARHPVAAVHAMVSGTRAEETWGLVVDEALALGLPMVLPRAGAYPEHFPGGGGALFYEPRDAASLSRALDRLRAEADLVPSLRASLPAVTDVVPTVRTYAQRLVDVYRRAIESGAPDVAPRDAERDAREEEREARWDDALGGAIREQTGLP